MDKEINPTTEEPGAIPGDGLPVKLSQLRQKLGQKAKQGLTGEHFRESRMREIRTSGSTRGEWAVSLGGIAHSPTLLAIFRGVVHVVRDDAQKR
ncbi:MAG: hypothetical protein NZ823_11395 [Blastocatellia bacterium]|nr:hypothetical protein [Blastocatellia bacterium]